MLLGNNKIGKCSRNMWGRPLNCGPFHINHQGLGREKKIMDMLEHGNLTKCQASFEDDKNFVIVTEMMNCDLHSLLNKINAPI